VINCYTSFSHVFNKLEEEMLTTVANQAAICIENSGLMETLDIEEILRLVLEGVRKISDLIAPASIWSMKREMFWNVKWLWD